MKIAVLGTGVVGVTIGTKLVQLGHEVTMGSRTPQNEKARAWAADNEGSNAKYDTFEAAVTCSELIFNCTLGKCSLEALELVGTAALKGKILVDVANPLDFSNGYPPSLSVCNDTSLGERIQQAFPDLRVVKSLNTVTASVMVDPSRVPGEHTIFVSGEDVEAKKFVEDTVLRKWFGWSQVLDLGGIESSRGSEMYLALWVRMWKALGTSEFNIEIKRNVS